MLGVPAGLDVRKAARLRQLLLAGEALSAELIRRTQAALPNCRIINGYGPTGGLRDRLSPVLLMRRAP